MTQPTGSPSPEAPLSEQTIRQALGDLLDPDTRRDLQTLEAIGKVRLCDGFADVDIASGAPGTASSQHLAEQVRQRLASLPGVLRAQVNIVPAVRRTAPKSAVLGGVKNVIAIASGKGGVGKSTVAANVACALKNVGVRVGLMDCDIYGPSQAMMFGIAGRPQVNAAGNAILPIEQYGIAIMSISFFLNEKTPIIWRGPRVHGQLVQFVTQVDWGQLDYLILDLPPGTGDAQVTITQQFPLSGAVIVSTPQDISLLDARKGLRMFREVNVPILGVVENMSVFTDPQTGRSFEIFRRGGVKRLCEEHDVAHLGEVPIDPEVVIGGDEGTPIVLRNPASPAAKALVAITEQLVTQLAGMAELPGDLPSLSIPV